MLRLKGLICKLIACLTLLFAVFSLTSCTDSSITEDSIRYTPVTVMRVIRSSIQSLTQYTGLVKPIQLAYAVTPVAGRVSSSFFEVGDRVSEGDLLFTVDSTEIEDGIRVLEKQLKAAEAMLSMAETQAAAASGSQYKSQKLQLETSLEMAEDNYTSAKEAFDASTLLMEAGLIKRLQYSQIKNQFEQSRNALESAVKAYELYESTASKDAIAAANDQMEQAQASCDMLRLQIDSTRKKLEYTRIKAPINGIVASKDIVTGCLISNTSVPYTIMDSDTVQVAISVTEQIINKVNKGDRLQVTIPSAGNQPFSGVVATVSPAIDPKTFTYSILIDIANKGNIIKPGMTAKVGIVTEHHDDRVVVPLSSVLSDDKGSFVYLVDHGRAMKRTVDTGIINKEQVEISGGLETGELLVVKGQQFLSENASVSISEEVKR